MKKHVVVLEAEGGKDKWIDGHRRDTMPIVNALKAKGFDSEVIYFRDEWKDEVFKYISQKSDAVIVRINPGNLPNGEAVLFDTLRRLYDNGVLVMTHPDTMMRFGAKDALAKLAGTPLVPKDTYAYYDYDEFAKTFPKSLSKGTRVLKQNRGSTGNGIWRVEVVDERVKNRSNDALPLDTKIKCTEALDNHVEYHTLGEFMEFCKQYVEGDNGMIVDMRFMPRIVEGEIRILMVADKPIFVVHKKPAQKEDAFSATIASGAKYTYYDPSEYKELVDMFVGSIPMISEKLGKIKDAPIIWTGDFMLDTDENGKDTYVLGEMNCSCVGFFSHLDKGIQDMVADEVIRRIKSKKDEAV
ncbi:MAG: Cj0069 family protein [Epsilonproteobacteria bacterium]|nr:Cj0069 family protein [Campylobacterota bacterium]